MCVIGDRVVASSGTALTPDQIRLINRLTNNITVLFDGDAAGIIGAGDAADRQFCGIVSGGTSGRKT